MTSASSLKCLVSYARNVHVVQQLSAVIAEHCITIPAYVPAMPAPIPRENENWICEACVEFNDQDPHQKRRRIDNVALHPTLRL
jgi:hypothetical protein